jgi:hypothetical protein
MQITNNRTIRKSALLAVCAWLFFPVAAQAQIRIYNQQRDEQAQAAEKLAEAIRNGLIFERQLKNLAVLARKDFDAEFTTAKFQMNSDTLTILTWSDAIEKVCQIERVVPTNLLLPGEAEIKKSLEDLDRAVAEAKKSLEDLRQALKKEEKEIDPAFNSLFIRLGDFADLLDLARKLEATDNQRANQAISQITGTIGQLQKVYGEYKKLIEAYNKEKEKLADVRLALKKVAVESLQVDEAYWKEIAAILARQEAEMTLTRSLINQYAVYAFQFGLTDFDPGSFPKNRSECDPRRDDCAAKARERFYKAVAEARKENNPAYLKYGQKYSQTLAESAKELAAHLQSLEKDNQEVIREAKAALLKLADKNAAPNLAGILRPVIDRLNAAVARLDSLNPNDLAHRNEVKARDLFAEAAMDLGQSASVAGAEEALRGAIIAANNNVVTHRGMALDFGNALYDLAALLARGDTPALLAKLRSAHARRAYSIRKSAVNARAYELIVSAGVKRLALYHKGGVKPETLAQLIQAISTAAIPPVILSQ